MVSTLIRLVYFERALGANSKIVGILGPMVDSITLQVRAGQGGHGSSSVSHIKGQRHAKADGGDGGPGGSVYVRGDKNKTTLYDLASLHAVHAGNGGPGGPSLRHGVGGTDAYILVSLGTTVRYGESGVVLGDILEDGQTILVAHGGRGGRGNARFLRSTHQFERGSEAGSAGEEGIIQLDLSLIADVGIIGLPNVGKSTFLNSITNAKSATANYSFTTLNPSLGVFMPSGSSGRPLFLADIPGLIEGASIGKGLGHQFLRHVSRTRLLMQMIAADSSDIRKDFQVVSEELAAYSPELLEKHRILVITKIDTVSDSAQLRKQVAAIPELQGMSVYFIDGLHREGEVDDLMREVVARCEAAVSSEAPKPSEPAHISMRELPNRRMVFRGGMVPAVEEPLSATEGV